MKKFFSIVCLVVFMTCSVSTVLAATWQNVGTDKDGYEWRYDVDTLLIDDVGHCTVTFVKVHPTKKTWYKGELSIIPMRRLSSLNRWEEHKKGNQKYTYWTYDYKLKSYSAGGMYDLMGQSILSLTK